MNLAARLSPRRAAELPVVVARSVVAVRSLCGPWRLVLLGPDKGVRVPNLGSFRNAAAHPVSSLLVQASSSWKSFQDQRVVAVPVPWKWYTG
jgi:hypothetical protein